MIKFINLFIRVCVDKLVSDHIQSPLSNSMYYTQENTNVILISRLRSNQLYASLRISISNPVWMEIKIFAWFVAIDMIMLVDGWCWRWLHLYKIELLKNWWMNNTILTATITNQYIYQLGININHIIDTNDW